MSNVDDEGGTITDPKPHLMIIVFIQEERPDLRILDSWYDSVKTLGMFGMDACPECNSDPRNVAAYSTCQSCRLVGSGPVEIPEHVLHFGEEYNVPTEDQYPSDDDELPLEEEIEEEDV